jgi:hypothetical protein
MFNRDVAKSALAGLLLFGSQFLSAQTVSNSSPGTIVTTGIVGLTGAQTARLNVLNLQPVIPGVAAVACPATLEFYDDAGVQLKQLAITSIAPAAATNLTFKPAVPSAATGRAQLRAVVFTPSSSVTNSGYGGLLQGMGCSVMASLEIIDDATGATHTVITDFRSMPSYRVMMSTGGR